MFLFGVTGGIGSGKTSVCEYLREKNLCVLNSDSIAKELINNHPGIQKKLIELYGREIYSKPNLVNTARLSRLVFEDEDARNNINRVVHPLVFARIQKEAEMLVTQTSLLGVEAALIYESRMEIILNAVVVVDAPVEKRIAWIQQRNNLSREEIEKRMQSQMPVAEKRRMANYIVENDSDLDSLYKKAETLYHWLLEKSSS